MCTLRVLLSHFILYLFASIECGKCPSHEVMDPCICEDNTTITCGGNEKVNLKQIFINISLNLEAKDDKHFHTFFLNNTAITELEDNTFNDITFVEIIIENTTSLNKISSKVFSTKNIDTIQIIEYMRDSISGVHQYINDIFTATSSLINAKEIQFRNTQLASVPENAFNFTNGLQTNLSRLIFYKNQMESLGNNAFYYLNNLTFIAFDFNNINRIPKHAFDFSEKSENYLVISLWKNKLNDTSIELGAFANAKRPLSIELSHNELTTLDERIFGPILQMDKRTLIAAHENPFECDCRMYWLFKGKNSYHKQIEDLTCKNGHEFWSLTSSNFNNCIGFEI